MEKVIEVVVIAMQSHFTFLTLVHAESWEHLCYHIHGGGTQMVWGPWSVGHTTPPPPLGIQEFRWLKPALFFPLWQLLTDLLAFTMSFFFTNLPTSSGWDGRVREKLGGLTFEVNPPQFSVADHFLPKLIKLKGKWKRLLVFTFLMYLWTRVVATLFC